MSEKCFEYNATVCRSNSIKFPHTFTWTRQKLVRAGQRPITKCHPVKECTIEVQQVPGTNQVPAKRVSAQLGELMGYVLCQTRSKMKCTAIV